MKKSKKNKKGKNTKKYKQRGNNSDNYDEMKDNAAPSIHFNDDRSMITEDNCAPAEDLYINDFNQYIKALNEKRKGKEAIILNNFDIKYNKKKLVLFKLYDESQ